MDDVLIVGGGVIGLSLAYELAGRGLKVRILERNLPGQESSWAGAGILPPANRLAAAEPYEQLAGWSCELHAAWHEQLRQETGIDNGYRRCGGVYLATSSADARALHQAAGDWRRQQVPCETIEAGQLSELEPALAAEPELIRAAVLLPEESQLRNPRHLQALVAACSQRKVELTVGAGVEAFDVAGDRIRAVRTAGGSFFAEAVCITGGAWTAGIVEHLGMRVAIRPIRGQIALLNCTRALLRRVINDGPRYLVPRPDGRVLVGSTEEDAGFDKRTTVEAIAGLLAFALRLSPALGEAQLERSWAGLRPGTADGLPYLGAIPGLKNAYVAAGHFRSGLYLSPATAMVMSQLIRGEAPEIDLRPFRLDRG
jgi:glycine oxidase